MAKDPADRIIHSRLHRIGASSPIMISTISNIVQTMHRRNPVKHRFNTVSVLNSKAIQYRNRIKFLQATVPFARRFWSDSSEHFEEVYQHKMTDPIIARLVLD